MAFNNFRSDWVYNFPSQGGSFIPRSNDDVTSFGQYPYSCRQDHGQFSNAFGQTNTSFSNAFGQRHPYGQTNTSFYNAFGQRHPYGQTNTSFYNAFGQHPQTNTSFYEQRPQTNFYDSFGQHPYGQTNTSFGQHPYGQTNTSFYEQRPQTNFYDSFGQQNPNSYKPVSNTSFKPLFNSSFKPLFNNPYRQFSNSFGQQNPNLYGQQNPNLYGQQNPNLYGQQNPNLYGSFDDRQACNNQTSNSFGQRESNSFREIEYELTRSFAVDPTVFDDESPGIDLYFPAGGVGTVIQPGEQVKINTHVIFKLPKGMVGIIMDKSSVVTRKQLKVEAGLIDTGYRGEIVVVLRNMSRDAVEISPGEAIAQMLLQETCKSKLTKVIKIDDNTHRGTRSFGETQRVERCKIL